MQGNLNEALPEKPPTEQLPRPLVSPSERPAGEALARLIRLLRCALRVLIGISLGLIPLIGYATYARVEGIIHRQSTLDREATIAGIGMAVGLFVGLIWAVMMWMRPLKVRPQKRRRNYKENILK